MKPWFDLLACPECRQPLTQAENGLRCADGHAFALSNGVPVRGVLVQAFRFRDAVASPHRSGGPVTMPPQGAFAPWRSPTPTP